MTLSEDQGSWRLIRGVLYTVLSGILLAGIMSLIRIWGEFSLLQERHAVMAKVDAHQTAMLESCQEDAMDQRRLYLVIAERQASLLKVTENHSTQLSTTQTFNVEQQYEIGQLRERIRYLERQAYPFEAP